MAKTEKIEKPEVKSAFSKAMEKTRLGDTVLYYEQGDPEQQPLAAIVSKVAATGLCLHVFSPRGLTVRDYIRHIEDPWFTELEGREAVLREKGAWDTLSAGLARQAAQAQARQEALRRRIQAEEADRKRMIDEQPLMEDTAMMAEELARSGLSLPEIASRFGGRVTVGQLQNHFELHPISA
jgi:hypothetical protein